MIKKKPAAQARVEKLTIALASGLPDSFRLFSFGENSTTKGSFLFDEAAAALVMAAYEAHGVLLAIDLEHAMLDDRPQPDPTARDARGSCGLELRADGLYAVDVRWTADGAARLTEKRQRYISPAFAVDPKTNRIIKIVNVAITSTPATFQTPALVAASALGDSPMTIDEFLACCKALGLDPKTTTLEDALAKLKGETTEPAAEEPAPKTEAASHRRTRLTALAAPAPAPAAPAASDADAKAAIAAAVGVDPTDSAAVLAAVQALFGGGEAAPAKVAPAEVAARATILKLTGATTLASAAAEVTASMKERQELSAERDELVSAERIRLCTSLVTVAGRAPATVWADPHVKGVAKPHLMKMTIAELKQHVADETGAAGKRPALRPPTGDGPESLSARERATCAEMGVDPKDYAARKAQRAVAR